jgi:hypothetical protein
MDAEAKLQQYLLLGKSAKGRSMCELITKATAEPGLFTFGELLDLPTVQEVRASARLLGDLLCPVLCCSQLLLLFCDLQLQGEFAAFRALLELFCYGTYPEYQREWRSAASACACAKDSAVAAVLPGAPVVQAVDACM